MSKILEVNNLNISFHTFAGEVKAIRGANFHLNKGETLAIVGESGSGKSVTTKAIMRLLPESNSEIKDGEILFDGKDLTKLSDKQMQAIRGKEISMIFQDPMTSLNPTMTVGKQIMEPIIKHQKLSKSAAKQRAIELLKETYTNLGPRLASSQVEIHDDFIQQCLDRLHAAYDTVSLLNRVDEESKVRHEVCL